MVDDADGRPRAHDHVPLDKVHDALALMSEADLARLRGAAHALGGSLLLVDPEDLLMEAMARTTEGTRRWRKDLTLAQHLYGTMRSMADQYREEQLAELHRRQNGSDDAAARMPSEIPNGEELLLRTSDLFDANRPVHRLSTLFADDGDAQSVLLGLASGLSAQEIRSEFGYSSKEYATIRRRMRRKIDGEFPMGWVHAN